MKITAIGKIFSLHNRGILLDVFVFLLNVFLMRMITKNFAGLLNEADHGDELAISVMFLFCLGIFILPPLGATLKRWHFHDRLKRQGKPDAPTETGCLFNPIFFFCLNIIIYSILNTLVLHFFYGEKEPDGAVFVSSILFGIVLVIFQTIIVYRYFSPPKTVPTSEFMRGPLSERLGDVCIFLNMILFQVAWNMLATAPLNRVSGFTELLGRLFFISFLALLVYFPPRIFYLAEDINRRRVWLTILLANSPVIWRLVFGAG